MKKIEAIISPRLINALTEVLDRQGPAMLTVSDVLRFDAQHSRRGSYRGVSYRVPFVDEIKVELLVDDTRAAGVLQAVRQIVSTDALGPRKVWVSSVDDEYESQPAPRRVMAG